ncbi:MAG: hypothetical protein FWG74_05135 [Planctomycetes bacterium]|nr:hypothetical protein [Planctomycetota bacterium]
MNRCDIFKELKEIEKLSDIELKNLSVIELEELAVRLKRIYFEVPYYFNILYDILQERYVKLNHNFSWTKKNKIRILEINNKLMNIFENAYTEAVTIAENLERRIRENDLFLNDYEIIIEIQPYTFAKNMFKDGEDGFDLVLSEPKYYPISEHLSHSDFLSDKKSLSVFLDKSLNWNHEYLEGMFNDHYICYQIHALLEYNWAFQDIINIWQIWANVKVCHQHRAAVENL